MSQSLHILVDFPALDRFVTFLQDRDKSQEKIDETAVTISALTQRLQKTRVLLKGALDNQ